LVELELNAKPVEAIGAKAVPVPDAPKAANPVEDGAAANANAVVEADAGAAGGKPNPVEAGAAAGFGKPNPPPPTGAGAPKAPPGAPPKTGAAA
jgi:hypothetical protein